MRSGAMRDVVVLVAVFGTLLGGLWLFTGTWPPAVIVESGSMMHLDSEVTYGRIGTIDPGDLVLVKDVDGPADVHTYVEGDGGRYGLPGDVVVYYKRGDRSETPVIHRAMAYVEVEGAGAAVRYAVRWDPAAACPAGVERTERDGWTWCVWGQEGISIDRGSDLRLTDYQPRLGGFITKGDNPATNVEPDQISGLSRDDTGPVPVQMAWVEGKARGEVPWLGLIKLALAPAYNQPECAQSPGDPSFHFFTPSPRARCTGWIAFGHAYAPKDLWVMLAVMLLALIVGPLGYDAWKGYRARHQTPPPPPSPPNAP